MAYEKQIWNKYDDLKTEEENSDLGAVVTDSRMNHIEDGISDHTLDFTNPHNVSKTQVGLGNLDNVKQATKVEFDAHIGNTSNPHKVTADQVGLGSVDNIKQATKVEFDAHLSNVSNPHSVTATQVGAYSKTESDGKYGTITSLSFKANDSSVIHNSGDESITGTKTFDTVIATKIKTVGDTDGWADLAPINGFSGNLKYRILNGHLSVRAYALTAPAVNQDTAVIIAKLPSTINTTYLLGIMGTGPAVGSGLFVSYPCAIYGDANNNIWFARDAALPAGYKISGTVSVPL